MLLSYFLHCLFFVVNILNISIKNTLSSMSSFCLSVIFAHLLSFRTSFLYIISPIAIFPVVIVIRAIITSTDVIIQLFVVIIIVSISSTFVAIIIHYSSPLFASFAYFHSVTLPFEVQLVLPPSHVYITPSSYLAKCLASHS